jgi:predicted GNAT family acetyltransferase
MMEINFETIEIRNNEAENRFEATINGYPAKLDYLLDRDTFVITHVGVHPELRGQGVAGHITKFALEYAKSRSLRVIPMCSYAAAYIHRNPQYIELTRQHPD